MGRHYSRGKGLTTIILVVVAALVIAGVAFGASKLLPPDFFGSIDAQPTATQIILQSPTASPTPSPRPSVTPVVVNTPAATIPLSPTVVPTPAATPAPQFENATVWASALSVRAEPSLNADKLGSVKRGSSFDVLEEKEEWLKIRYEGSYGWIWRAYCARGNEPLPTVRPDPLVKEFDATSKAAHKMVVKITFKEKVYGASDKSKAVDKADFKVSDGAEITKISGNDKPTTEVTLEIDPKGASSVRVYVLSGKVYTESGTTNGGSSERFSLDDPTPTPGTTTPAPTATTPAPTATPTAAPGGVGAIGPANISVSGDHITGFTYDHNAGEHSVDISVVFTDATTITVTCTAYAVDGSPLPTKTTTFSVSKPSGASGNHTVTFDWGEPAYGSNTSVG